MIRRMKNFFGDEPDQHALSDSAPKHGVNIVLFPRKYMVDGNPEYHYVEGLTLDGRTVKVRLQIDPAYLDDPSHDDDGSAEEKSKFIPRLSEFARTDIKAPRPCLSSPTNAPNEREGILLFSKAHATNPEHTEYVAGWAVVLAKTSDDPDPMFGLGRIDIKYIETAECHRIKKEIFDLEALVGTPKHTADVDRELSRLARELHDATNCRFRAYILDPSEITRVENINEDNLRMVITRYLSKYTDRGMYGGCFVRAIERKTGLVTRYSDSLECYFDRGTIIQADQAYTEFMYGRRNDAGKVISGGRGRNILYNADTLDVDIIPFQIVNCGPLGNRHYKDYERHNALINTFTDPNTDLPMLCDIAIRPWVNSQTGNTLLARLYAISPMKGSELELDQNGNFTFRLEGKSYTGAVHVNNSNENTTRSIDSAPANTSKTAIQDQAQLEPSSPPEPSTDNKNRPRTTSEPESDMGDDTPSVADIPDCFDFDGTESLASPDESNTDSDPVVNESGSVSSDDDPKTDSSNDEVFDFGSFGDESGTSDDTTSSVSVSDPPTEVVVVTDWEEPKMPSPSDLKLGASQSKQVSKKDMSRKSSEPAEAALEPRKSADNKNVESKTKYDEAISQAEKDITRDVAPEQSPQKPTGMAAFFRTKMKIKKSDGEPSV